MRKLMTLLPLILIGAACSNQTDQVATAEKSKLTSEQILENKQCAQYKLDLNSGKLDSAEIEKLYSEATRAHCIKKDI